MPLQLTWHINQQPQNYHFSETRAVTIGRKRNCDIVLGDRTVSRRHAEVFVEADAVYLQNLSQTNAIYVYTRCKLKISEGVALKPGDTLQLGLKKMQVQGEQSPANTSALQLVTAEVTYTLGHSPAVIIGRQADCDIVLHNRTVSRHHAEIYRAEDQFWIRNLSQASPVYVYAQQRLGYGQMTLLNAGDAFKIGPTRIHTQSLQTMINEQRSDLAQLYQVQCHGCRRKIKANHKDCLWCGVSLACETTAA